MTIPITTPQIGATGVVPSGAEQALSQAKAWFDVAAMAMQRRQELDIAREKLAQDREQFELQKKIAGPTIAGMELDNERKKRDFQRQDEDYAAQDEALKIFTGALPQAHDMQAWGQVIAGVKDPAVGRHLMENIRGMFDLQNQQATGRKTAADAAQVEAHNNADVATQGILQRYGAAKLATVPGQRAALAEVAALAGPERANELANAFNVGSGRHHLWAGPDGFLYDHDTKLGEVRQLKSVGTKAGNALNQEAIKRGAQTIVELLDEQSRIIDAAGLRGSKNPSLAQVAQTARFLGIPTEGLANILRSNPQQVTQMLKTRFAHNYVGLLPHSRSAANLLNNLTESYWAPGGSSDELLARAQQDRIRLRAIMAGVASGRITDLTRIPGFSDALKAAASENTPQAADSAAGPNPLDWLNPQ